MAYNSKPFFSRSQVCVSHKSAWIGGDRTELQFQLDRASPVDWVYQSVCSLWGPSQRGSSHKGKLFSWPGRGAEGQSQVSGLALQLLATH